MKCAFLTHGEHRTSIIDFKWDQIVSFIDKNTAVLTEAKNEIETIVSEL